jgi:cell division septation protein DedD
VLLLALAACCLVPFTARADVSGQGYAVQAGVFATYDQAQALTKELREAGLAPYVFTLHTDEETRHVVRLGTFDSAMEALTAAREAQLIWPEDMELTAAGSVEPLEVITAMVGPGEKHVPEAADEEADQEFPAETVHIVQVAAFRSEDVARTTLPDFRNKGFEPCILQLFDDLDRLWNIIVIGDFAERAEAVAHGRSYRGKTRKSYRVKELDKRLFQRRIICDS